MTVPLGMLSCLVSFLTGFELPCCAGVYFAFESGLPRPDADAGRASASGEDPARPSSTSACGLSLGNGGSLGTLDWEACGWVVSDCI